MRVICDNLNVHSRKKRYEERAVFLDMICTGVSITIACIGYFHHYNITFILLLTFYLRGYMKLI